MDTGWNQDPATQSDRTHVGTMHADSRIHPEVEMLAAQEARLNQELALLDPLQKAFRLWLRVHLPVSSLMVVSVTLIFLWAALGSRP